MEVDNERILTLGNSGNICRVCLSTNEINKYIFDTQQNNSNNTDTINLLEKLRLCSGIEILENDELPATVCMKCIAKVNDAYELRKQCQQSDIQLRGLYGKLKKKYNLNKHETTIDKWCQTDYSFTSTLSKVDNDILTIHQNISSITSFNSNVKSNENYKSINTLNYANQDELNNYLNEQNTYVKCIQTGYKKNVIGRDFYRTRRMTMFKKVTSIESLKNYKERQRQYIKKATNIKWNVPKNDCFTNVKNTHSLELYICTKCNRHYSNKKSLDKHLISHNEQMFKCNKCSKDFFHFDNLIEHKKLHVIKEKPKSVLCRICNKSFKKTDTMVRHLNVHKHSNPKEVLSILKEIRDKRKLENYTESGKTIITIKSGKNKEVDKEFVHNEVISDVLKNYRSASKHKTCAPTLSSIDTNSSENDYSCNANLFYKCKHCGKRYLTEKSLQRHLLIHVEKKFVCNVCNMKFYRQDRLESHKNRYGHNENKASFEIHKPSDDKSAIKLINSWIREELDSDNEEKCFPCEICGKSYDTKKSLSKHQLSIHNSAEGCMTCGKICTCDENSREQQKVNKRLKPYQCNECNKSFEKEIKLQKHMKIHERSKEKQDVNFKRFLCHICSKTFRQNTGLVFHMRTHTGYKPHVCKYCGRGFASNSNRINHERTHTGDRPFICHFCSAAFAKSCTLKAHITTHTGEANYHCKTCGKSFRRLKYLKEHRFTHTGEKPYACKICGTAYSHSGSLFVHEKKCKAQHNNYQSNLTHDTQTYCQSQTSQDITPIVTILPQDHLNVSDTMNSQNNKPYISNIQRVNYQNMNNLNTVNTSDSRAHSNSDISNVSLAVKSFALIQHMFQSKISTNQ